MDARTQALVAECERQEESCLYTSTTIYEWLKSLRLWRGFFIVTPVIAGSVASWQLVAEDQGWKFVAAFCAFIAGTLPAIYKALDFDVSFDALRRQAHAYKVLHDRFRQAARVTSLGDPADFKAEFDQLMTRMDDVRSTSLTPPERFFKKSQKKIKSGDYMFTADMKAVVNRDVGP